MNFTTWLHEQSEASPEALVAKCERGEWLLLLAAKCGYSRETLLQAVRPTMIRALKAHIPAVLEAEGLFEQAERLRLMPESMLRIEESYAVYDAAGAFVRAIYQDPRVQVSQKAQRMIETAHQVLRMFLLTQVPPWVAEVAGDVEAMEHARCADDVRAALPDLAERWAACRGTPDD